MNANFDNRRLKLGFAGAERIERTFSQAGQDLFVLALLNGKRDGVFLDLGCNHPIVINNTFLLESGFGWSGLSVDIKEDLFELFVFRKSQTLVADCTKLDWDMVVEKLGTSSIDYLSLDLEPPDVTLECLKTIPFEKVQFSVITFEHDAYRSGDAVRKPSRKLLEDKGYVRLCSNVRLEGLPFEDWYCNPRFVDAERAAVLKADNQEWQDVVFGRE